MQSLMSFRRPLRAVPPLAVLPLLLALAAPDAKVTITVSDQMPPGLLFIGEKATWKFDIVVEPPQFKQDEIEYTFSSLKFIEDKLAPKEEGESLKATLPEPKTDNDKVINKGAVLETTAFEKVGKREILLKAQATYKTQGQPDVKVDSDETKLGLEVGALQIVDTLNKDAVIDKKVTTVVGKKIGLKGQIVPAPAATDVTDPLWTIPDAPWANPDVPTTTVKSYQTDAKTGMATGLAMADLGQDAVTFYWIAGGDGRNVQFQTKYKGRLVKTEAIFDVESPKAEMTSKTTTIAPNTDGVAIDDKWGLVDGFFLHFGTHKDDPGIAWTGKVTAPGASGGEVAFVQITNTLRTATLERNGDKLTLSSEGAFMLDSYFPYGPPKKVAANESRTLQGHEYSDSPAQGLSKDKFVSADDHFKTYLMFKPAGTDSIWVTLRVLEWNWRGAAIRDAKGAWDFGKDPPVQAAKNPDSKASTDLPTWTMNAADLEFNFNKEKPK